jgi:hypothetical protein
MSGGLPVGIMIGLGTAFFGPHTSWLDLILTTAVCAVAFAGLLTLVTEPFIKTFRRSAVTVGAMIVLVTVTILVGGIFLLEAADRVPHGKWERLPDPPEPARFFAGPTCHRLVGRDDGVVFVFTASGSYFAYHEDAARWTREATAPDTLSERGCRSRYRRRGTPMKAGRVVASYYVDDDGTDCGGRRYYRLLADGSIWEWSAGGCIVAWLAGHILFAIALLVVSAIVIYTRLRPSAWNAWRQSGTSAGS